MSLYEKSFLWTWDTRMNWIKDKSEIPRKMASPDSVIPYYGNEKLFLENYMRLIDLMKELDIPYVLIWGLLRDSHGGVDAAIKICEYAHEKNVKIIAGIGTQGYGGVYYEGKHKFNSSNWLAKHPELSEDAVLVQQNAVVELRGKSLCPSRPENIEWLLNGIEWLIKTIPIDGLYLENGDYINCACKVCNERRKNIKDIYDIYFRSLTISYQPIIDYIEENYPDIPVINTLYSGFNEKFLRDHSGLFSLSKYENTFNLWTLTNTSKQEEWEKNISFKNDNNLAYFHYFSTANNSHKMLFAKEIYENFVKLSKLRFKGVAIYGEESADSIVGLANYFTFAECIKNTDIDFAKFMQTILPEKLINYGFATDSIYKELNKNKEIHFGCRGI